MRRLAFLALLAVLAIAGCGSQTSTHKAPVHTTPPAPAPEPFMCHPKDPPQMGECIRQELEHGRAHPKVLTLAPPTASLRAQGIDISRWQPHPRFGQLFAEGIRFVMIQAADNTSASNPFFGSQVREAHAHRMQVGVYIFEEGGSSTAQADTVIRVARPYRPLISLGAAVDAEVSSAYPRACGTASVLARSFHIVSVYGSPGTYRGGRCVGVQWPAEWGSSHATPLPSYPFSTIRLRQWCGTCRLGGNDGEIDRDEDLGILAMSHPKPKPKPLTKYQQLAKAYIARSALNGELTRLNCLHGYDHYTRAHRARCTSLRHRHGVNSRQIKRLHAEGAF